MHALHGPPMITRVSFGQGGSSGGASSGAGSAAASSTGVPVVGSAPQLPLSGGRDEARAELRALRLQELQWRFINAKMEQALHKRREQVRHSVAGTLLCSQALLPACSVQEEMERTGAPAG